MGDDNIVVRLGDIADVRLEYPEKEYYVDSNGNELVVVQVTKRSDGNVVDLSKQIRALLDESERSTGGAVTYRVLSDDSKTTMASLKTVITSGLMGIVMAVLIVLIFLGNVRATIIIGLSIPLSLLFTFIGLKIAGYSINLMTLSGMVIALGMVVDASIVMLEQVYRYYTRKTGKLDDNIIRASDDVGSSIFASGATTIVVFIPIAMLTGIIGSILRQASITIALAIFASLVVAVVIVPFLASKILKPVYEEKKRVRIFDRVMNKIEKGYEFSLNWSMKNRRFILLIAVALLLISLEVLGFLGFSFIPSTDNGDFYVNFEFPQGISLDEARRKVNRAEEIIRAEVPEIESAVFFTGMDSQSFFGINSPTSAYGQIVLVPVAERDRSIQEIILDVQGALAGEIPNCSVSTENGGFDRLVGFVSGGGGYGITLVSEDLMKLYDNAVRIEDFLKDDPSVTVTSMNMSFDASELVIGAVHDYLDSLGVSSYEAGMTTAILFNGVDAGRLTLDGERYGIHLSSDVSERGLDPNSLSDISITSLAGEQISFANISDLRAEQSVNAIHHSDRAKTITISAKLVSEDLSGVTARVDQYLAENPLSDGVKSKQGGIGELVSDSIGPMVIALLTSIFLVYTVMVLQFERFRQPFLILGTIPFTVIGITLGLLAFGSTLNVISMMGVISLSGIVVNNAIILIDCVNQNRKEPDIETEEDLVQSVKAASASRLRPILMTTLTTLLGAIPMAVATGEGSEIYAPLGQAIAGGLLSSTVITLFIIPVLYYLTEKRKLKRRHTDNEEK